MPASRKLSIDEDRTDMENALFHMFLVGNAGLRPKGGFYGKIPFRNIIVMLKEGEAQEGKPMGVIVDGNLKRHFREIERNKINQLSFSFLRLFSWENYDRVKFEFIHVAPMSQQSDYDFREFLLPINSCRVLTEDSSR